MIRRFARPYAKALMDIVTVPAEKEKIFDDLARFEALRVSSGELSEVLANPAVDLGRKSAIVDAIARRLGLSTMAVRVIAVLAQNRRVNQLGDVLAAWREMLNASAGVTVAEVSSAHELSEAEKKRLQETLETKFGTKIDLQLKLDEKLLGGFVAQIGSEVYDASVLGQIQKIKQTISI